MPSIDLRPRKPHPKARRKFKGPPKPMPFDVALRKFSGQDFLLHFAIPQFLFHTTTAYDIIRNADIEIGKQDFLGNASTQ